MQSTHMRKSKAKSFKGIKHGILQMTGHLLNHHHTSEVQTKHATSSVSTPTADTTTERAFDVSVCQLMPSASLPPSDCRRSHCRLATKLISSQNSQKTNYVSKSKSACWLGQIHGASGRGDNRVLVGAI
jgi:hypothetical protein